MPRLVDLTATETADPDTIVVTAVGPLGQSSATIPLSLGAFAVGMAAWDDGALVQDAFPSLSAAEREFLMTGLDEHRWRAVFRD